MRKEHVQYNTLYTLKTWAVFFSLFILLFLAESVSALPTSTEQVRRVVQYWLFLEQQPLSASLGSDIDEIITFRDDAGTPLYHVVYLDPKGFVIVSGDDLVEPIIAFVPDGEFDPSPDNPLGALVSQDMSQRIAAVQGVNTTLKYDGTAANQVLKAKQKWNQFDKEIPKISVTGNGESDISDERVGPLLENESGVEMAWSQRTEAGGQLCYNLFTPHNYYAGCTATAMAQLMRFHEHPSNAVGTPQFSITVKVDGADPVQENRSLRGGDGSGGAYNWGIMDYGPYIDEASHREAIGSLTHDTGVSINSDYSGDGTGGGTFTAADRLTTTFSYANAIKGYLSSLQNIPALNRNKMVNPNLDAGLPVLFSIRRHVGDDPDEGWYGHTVVGDGYGYHANTMYHHLNMGWRGDDNAWYNLPDIQVDTESRHYTVLDICIYNIYTDGSGEIISGRILDNNGVLLSGVTVSAQQSGGGIYTATTNNAGIYALVKIPALSDYTINAVKAGFAFNTRNVTTGESVNRETTVGNLWGVDFLGTEEIVLPEVSTQAATNISYTTATGHGTLSKLGNPNTQLYGICWNTTGEPTVSDPHTNEGVAVLGSFTGSMTGLIPVTTYYVRAYAYYTGGVIYGNEVALTTLTINQSPTLVTGSVVNISTTTATGQGLIGMLGSPLASQHGVCWNRTGIPTTSDDCTQEGSVAVGLFTTSMTNLSPGTKYYVRAYAINILGPVYGNEVSFTTDNYTLPSLTTGITSDITAFSATGNGWVYQVGNPPMSQHGFCWDLSSNPTTANSCTQQGTRYKAGSFTGEITGLMPATTYFIRAYAVNAAGTAYGAEKTFDTSDTSSAIHTGVVTYITSNHATGSGYIELNGGGTLSQHGICWSKSTAPTTNNFCSQEGSASKTVAFTSSISSLNTGGTYYVRAYGTDQQSGNSLYGNEVSFTTATYPQVSTQAVSNIDLTSAIGNGIIDSLGSPDPFDHGICWSTSIDPTRADNCISLGSADATGLFQGAITGLSIGTSYHVRAFASNRAGTRYGSDVPFVAGASGKFPWVLFRAALMKQ